MHFTIQFTEEELKNEIWKNIPNYDGYQASNLGRIRTHNKTTYTELRGVRKWKDRIMHYKTTNGNEYITGYRVDLWKNGKSKTLLVARLVASTFFENYLDDRNITVNHINGNRLDNRIENLEWCSLRENIQKGFETGLFKQYAYKITNKITHETKILRSQSQASIFMGKNHGYINHCEKRNKFENETYNWERVK